MDAKTIAIFEELPELRNLGVRISTIAIQRVNESILNEGGDEESTRQYFILDGQGRSLCQVGIRIEAATFFWLAASSKKEIPHETVGRALTVRLSDEDRKSAALIAQCDDDGEVVLWRVPTAGMGLVEYLTRDVRDSVRNDLGKEVGAK